MIARLVVRLNAPVDASSVRAFRVLFGLAMAVAGLRFFTHDWITHEFTDPHHFFHYWGFGWVSPLPARWMEVLFVVLVVSALAIACGWYVRASSSVFAVAFIYAHLCDKANYLNHYYLVGLLACWFVVLPLGARADFTRAWVLYVLRFQVGVVYVFGGIGKLGVDWLMHGEPMRLWLSANAGLPVVGRLFDLNGIGLLASWCGALFDLGIVPALIWRQTRGTAYVVLVVFHVLTAMLFNIGMFPWLMIIAATLFFPPDWSRRYLPHLGRGVSGPQVRFSGLVALTSYALIQVLVPLRTYFYPGNTLWTEEGFRFAWRVMLIEKSGDLEFRVVDGESHVRTVSPRAYCTPFQARMAGTQPDMILELAHWIAKDNPGTQVFADAPVSFNGRFGTALVNPNVDLAREQDTLAHKTWIMPAPRGPPDF
ncbi:MAG: HTTM domain-containing protein [Clostridia bacterium]|nr:HTTM domain-containing protein [Deltaproteobacteria bacterium]